MAPTHLLQLERACKKVAKMDGNDFSSSLFNQLRRRRWKSAFNSIKVSWETFLQSWKISHVVVDYFILFPVALFKLKFMHSKKYSEGLNQLNKETQLRTEGFWGNMCWPKFRNSFLQLPPLFFGFHMVHKWDDKSAQLSLEKMTMSSFISWIS